MTHTTNDSHNTWLTQHNMTHTIHDSHNTWLTQHMTHTIHDSHNTWLTQYMTHTTHDSHNTWLTQHMTHTTHDSHNTTWLTQHNMWLTQHMTHTSPFPENTCVAYSSSPVCWESWSSGPASPHSRCPIRTRDRTTTAHTTGACLCSRMRDVTGTSGCISRTLLWTHNLGSRCSPYPQPTTGSQLMSWCGRWYESSHPLHGSWGPISPGRVHCSWQWTGLSPSQGTRTSLLHWCVRHTGTGPEAPDNTYGWEDRENEFRVSERFEYLQPRVWDLDCWYTLGKKVFKMFVFFEATSALFLWYILWHFIM